MPSAKLVLAVTFLAALVAYYVIAWTIRGEGVDRRPSFLLLLNSPFSIRRANLTDRGQKLHRALVWTWAAVIVLGLAAFIAHMLPSLTSAPS
jgi:cytochrome b561